MFISLPTASTQISTMNNCSLFSKTMSHKDARRKTTSPGRQTGALPKSQLNIHKFFQKRVHPVYAERLKEDVKLLDKNSSGDVDFNKENEKKNTEVCQNVEVHQNAEEIVALKNKIATLENDNEQLQKKNAKLLKDNQAMKKLLDTAKNLNLYKDIKIQQLKYNSMPNLMPNLTAITASGSTSKILFEKYEDHFEAAELIELRSCGKGKRQDCGFITKCIRFLYHENMAQIANKCSGDRKIKNKTPISPGKKVLMENMLSERVESEGVDELTALERRERFNRLVGDSIHNLTKRPAYEKKIQEINLNPNANANQNCDSNAE